MIDYGLGVTEVAKCVVNKLTKITSERSNET